MGTYRKVGEGLHKTINASALAYECGKSVFKPLNKTFANLLDTAYVVEAKSVANGEKRRTIRWGGRTTKIESDYSSDLPNMKTEDEKSEKAPKIYSIRKLVIASSFLYGMAGMGNDNLKNDTFNAKQVMAGMGFAGLLIKPKGAEDSVGTAVLKYLNSEMKRAHLEGVKLARRMINYDKIKDLRNKENKNNNSSVKENTKGTFKPQFEAGR